ASLPTRSWLPLVAVAGVLGGVGAGLFGIRTLRSRSLAEHQPIVTPIPAAEPTVATDVNLPPAPPPPPQPTPVAVALAPAPEPIPAPPPPPATRQAPRRSRQAAGDAYLTVNATPWGAVYVDGRRLADETPVYRRRVSPGDHMVIVRYADGGSSPPKRIHLAAG